METHKKIAAEIETMIETLSYAKSQADEGDLDRAREIYLKIDWVWMRDWLMNPHMED